MGSKASIYYGYVGGLGNVEPFFNANIIVLDVLNTYAIGHLK